MWFCPQKDLWQDQYLDGDSFPTITHLNVRSVHVHLFAFAELQILIFFIYRCGEGYVIWHIVLFVPLNLTFSSLAAASLLIWTTSFFSFRSWLHSAGHQRDPAEGFWGRGDSWRKWRKVQSGFYQHWASRLPQVPPLLIKFTKQDNIPYCVSL